MDNAFFPVKDFARSLVAVAPSPDTSGTSLEVTAAEGALFPAPATAGVFRAYVWPIGALPDTTNCEEIEVTARSTDTFTIVRAKNGVSRAIVVGDQISINFGKSKEDQILQAFKDGVIEDKLLPGESYSRDSVTQFKTPGDKTGWYTKGRIIRVNDSGSYTTHTVVTSSYSASNTIVTVEGVDLPAALTNIYLGIQPKGYTDVFQNNKDYIKKVHQIYAIGDSLTAAGVYETQLKTLLGNFWNVTYNWGGSTSGVLARMETDVLSHSDAEYVIVWIGINDVATDVAAATIEADLQSIYTLAHNAGLKVIAVNITPFKGSASYSAGRQVVLDAVNAWISGTATDVDYIIDAYSVLEDPAAADTLLAAYDSGDHIHLSTTGYNLVGTTIYNGVVWSPADNGIVDPDSFNPLMLTHLVARNGIMNGNFNIWQRGVSFTNPSPPANIADLWGVNHNLGSPPTNIVITKQALTAGDIPHSFNHLRIAPDGAGTVTTGSYHYISTGVEHGVRLLCGIDKKVTLSFWARSSIANKRIGFEIRQNYGSGGTPTAGEVIKGNIITLTTYWKKYTYTFTTNTLANKVFGTNNDDVIFLGIWMAWGSDMPATFFNTGTGAENFVGSGNIDIAQVQICSGEVALPYYPRSYHEELDYCHRYCYQIDGPVDILPTCAQGTAAVYAPIVFPTEMKGTPTLETSTITGANFQNVSGAAAQNITSIALVNPTKQGAVLNMGATVTNLAAGFFRIAAGQFIRFVSSL